MRQLIKNVCFFRRLVIGSGILFMAVTAVAQQDVDIPKILTPGDSLLIKELYFKGIQLKSSGQLAAAEMTFDKLILLQPDNDAAHFELARIYFEKEDYVAAERAVKQAVGIDADNEWYWSMLVDIYKKTRNVQDMAHVFDELIRLHPDKISNYQEKAYALYLDKQYNASLAVYDTIAHKFGETDEHHLTKYQIHLAQRDTQSAIRELESLISKNPKDGKGYILLAGLYTEIQAPRKAIALLDDAAIRFPREPLILLGKSDAYLAMNKQKQASVFLRQAFASTDLDIDAKAGILYAAIENRKRPMALETLSDLADLLAETYPREAKAYAVKGDIYMQLQQLERAREAYLKALDINQYIEGIWQQLLQVELQMGKYDDAELHGKEALTLFPNHPIFLFFTGHGFLGNKRYQEARVYLENALNAANEEHTPLLTQLYGSLGDTYNALEMHAESDVAYEEAIALDSTNAYVLNNYAYYLALRKEKLPLAAQMSKKSNELVPDYPSYEDTYAWVLFQQGKYAEALKWIEKAVKNSVTPSETLLEHYGDILAKLGDINGAVVKWKKAKSISESVGKDIDKLSRKIDAKQFID